MEEKKDLLLGTFMVDNTPAYVTIDEERFKEVREAQNKRKNETE